jgi:RNA polymerase sigma-70 factor (ECF subfamily)
MATGQTSAMMALRDPDIRLMLRVRSGDTAAFADLVQRYQHRLLSVLTHLLGRTGEAEDLAQEVFLRVYKTREKYTPRAKFSTWLFRIAHNLALNSLRDQKRKQTLPLEVGSSSQSAPLHELRSHDDQREPAPSQQLQNAELSTVIQQALAGLNERQRMAVVLNKFEDMNYADIAEVMGMTVQGVKSLLNRARMNLREALQPYVYMDQDPPEVSDDDER